MTEFLVKHFVKDYECVEKMSVRTAYGILASIVGIFCNMFLFIIKLAIGIGVRSVSVMADGFNNLSDACSSVISFIGVRMAGKPADEKHPFGHGRVEYISALIVSFFVLEVGFTFLKDSLAKIRRPQELRFQLLSVVILLLSIGVKLWLGSFNRKLGKKINSKVMMAMFTDSMGDVVTTIATILSLIFFALTGINIDGFVGIGVALVVMWAGIEIARDTLEPLIGEGVDPELYAKIEKFVEKYDGIEGTHDLVVHNYGPNRSMASIHAEVPNDVNIEVSHEIIDNIEREAEEQLGMVLVIHMDPIETRDKEVLKVRAQITEGLEKLDENCSIHDFRMVRGKEHIKLIFDLVVPISYDEKKRIELEKQLSEKLLENDARYQFVITVEHSYISGKNEQQ
ncbi:cation diffusion facilitator family transporter [Clostridium sp. C105KSO13]|uniref:cation diffusion facilitator family transporter n=1 Tax=Clostridium sp. C105KSO13 TaxID=1776045 RepID=UPI0007406E33|nr:cation diffusion facilitator family transporter [Clostridium sp. C105KSO13]CUX24562.1 Ferrous-iron efflux pump FieF [Clostridium sp. C105KSO13]